MARTAGAGYRGQMMTMRTMTAKFAGRCRWCADPIKAGERIGYDPNFRVAMHERCITRGEKTVEAKPAPAAAPVARSESHGTGRVPADVDATREALATVEAVELATRSVERAPSGRSGSRCGVCGATRNLMTTGRGPACPEHYDDLSG